MAAAPHAAAARGSSAEESVRVEMLQARFTLIQVKVLLVSLLNGFRDLTLMGVQAFDFNHLNNVLISRDYRKARLIDIDGASKGSIQACTPAQGGRYFEGLHKPALDVDLATLLPLILQQLILGKGRGKAFVGERISRVVRRCGPEPRHARARPSTGGTAHPLRQPTPPARCTRCFDVP